VATVLMTAIMAADKWMGVQTWDVAKLIGSAMAFGRTVRFAEPLWVVGLGMHFLTGMCLFPLLYAHWVWGALKGPNWARGLTWGLFLWFMTQALFMPLAGQGFFAMDNANPLREMVPWLILLALYGLVFGIIAGPQEVRHLEVWPAAPEPHHHKRAGAGL